MSQPVFSINANIASLRFSPDVTDNIDFPTVINRKINTQFYCIISIFVRKRINTLAISTLFEKISTMFLKYCINF